MRPLLILTLCLLTLVPAAAAQRGGKAPKPEAIPYFDGKLEDAVKEISERNTSMLVLCCKEGEEANDRFREQLRDNASFAAALGDTLVLLVNDGSHERTKITRRNAEGNKEKVEVCEAYHTETCDQHKRNWDRVYQTWMADHADGAWPLPCALIINPDGTLHQLVATGQPPSDDEMLKPLKIVRAKAGPSITRDELRVIKELTADGEAMASARSWVDAWHAWNGILQITESGKFAAAAEEGRAAAAVGMQAQLEDLSTREGDPNAIYPRLAEFTGKAQGTPLEKEANKALAALAKHPDIDADLVKRIKLEMEADALLREAQALLRAGNEKAAKKVLKKLRAKKYEDTPAYAQGLGLIED